MSKKYENTRRHMTCLDCEVELIEHYATKRCKPCAIEKTKEIVRLSSRKYRQKNTRTLEQKKAKSQYDKAYREDNLEEIKKRKREKYLTDATQREKATRRTLKWQKDNKEKYNERLRAYHKKTGYAHQAKRKAIKLEALLTSSENVLMSKIYSECRSKNKRCKLVYHVDHIIPLAIGGAHHQDNLRIITACSNIRKGDSYNPLLGGVWANNDLAEKNRRN